MTWTLANTVARLAVVISMGVGCTKNEGAARKSVASEPTTAPALAAAPVAPSPAPRTDGGVVGPSPRPGSLPPLAPLAEGKRVRITKLYQIPPLEITAPPTMKLKMENLDEESELLPRAHLRDAELDILVMEPEGGFSTMADAKGMILRGEPKATFPRSEETDDGYLLIDWFTPVEGMPQRYFTTVSRPKLKVQCMTAQPVETLADAERVASVCLTLRPSGAARARN